MLIKQDFNYSPKNENRTLHIWLPDEYYWTDEKYPVMYLFDGHNMFRNEDATFGTCWGFQEFMRSWHKPMILVGMECVRDETGRERLSEYSPYSFANDYWGSIPAMGRETMEWIVNEVKPYIDANYRTWPFREGTAIGGSSMGGLMALYAGIKYNRWFSKMMCVSSAIAFNFEEVMRDVRESDPDEDSRFWFSWGSQEAGGGEDYSESGMARRNREVERMLLAKGAITHSVCQVGGRHCEADWSKQVPEIMHFLWE